MKALRAWFASRTGRLVVHDGTLAAAAAVAYLETTSQPIDRGVLIAAGVIAVKAFLRLILPVPTGQAPKLAATHVIKLEADTTQMHAALAKVKTHAEEVAAAVDAATKPAEGEAPPEVDVSREEEDVD